jgi:hypothetical protein
LIIEIKIINASVMIITNNLIYLILKENVSVKIKKKKIF